MATTATGGLSDGLTGNDGRNVEVEGTLRVVHSDDFRDRRARFDYELLTRNGIVELDSVQLPRGVHGGMQVRVRGRWSSGRLVADAGSVESTGGTQTVANTAGTRKVAVILFNFGNDTRQPYTPDQVRNVVFTGTGSVNAYFHEASFARVTLAGKLRTDGDVFGWYTIPNANSGCDFTGWASAARAAAVGAGVDLSGYDHYVYVFPQASGCGWAGLAYMPGKDSWINGSLNVRVVAHELSHNLGVHHAGTLSCTGADGTRATIASSCSFVEYGDPFDVMGSATRHSNTRKKAQLGWYDTANMHTVSATGSYTLAPLARPAAALQLLRIPRGTTGDFYYLEFRQPYGFDSFAATDPVVRGVSIRLGLGYTSLTASRLLDATPGTSSFLDSALAVGQTFTDSTYKISVRTESVSSTGATVRVTLGDAPAADTTPPSAPTGLTVTGRTMTSISISWSASSDNVGVAGYGIHNGGVRIGYVTATSANITGLTCGRTYRLGVDAADAAGNRSAATPIDAATTACATADTTAPAAPTSLTATAQAGPKVALSWTPSMDNVGVTGYRIFRNGSQIATSTSASYTDSAVAASTSYTYAVRAHDAAGNVSAASNSVTVTTPRPADTAPPSQPTGLVVLERTSTSITLGWKASSDNVGVAGYGGYRNGTRLGSVTTTSARFTGLLCNRSYTLGIDAFDAAGNRSPITSVIVSTRLC